MNIFKNKFFLLGNLAFLLLVIPVVLYFISNQTSTQGDAAATTTLSFNPSSMTVDQCTNTQTTRLIINPVDNVVATVKLALGWDKTKFDIEFQPNTEIFKNVLSGPEQTAEGLTVTLNTGDDVGDAVTTTTEVGTITIKPLAPTDGTVINLNILSPQTEIFSLTEEVAVANVYNAAGSSPFRLSITSADCSSISPTPTPTSPAGSGTSPSPSVNPTQQANTPPACQTLLASTSSGTAPLSVTFTATGSDSNGTIPKATFNFGDGSQQDVTSGLGTASVSAQLSHTYANGGTFNATVVFTDNSGAVSATCTKSIAVTGAAATTAPLPTATPTLAPIVTNPPTAVPTVAAPGGIAQSMGIVGGVVFVIIAGIFLLSL